MDNKLYAKIGMRIKWARQEMDLTQVELAEKIGISASYLSHIEAGNRAISVEVLIDVANALEYSVEYLLFGEEARSRGSKEVLEDNLLKELSQAFKGENGSTLRKLVRILVDNHNRL